MSEFKGGGSSGCVVNFSGPIKKCYANTAGRGKLLMLAAAAPPAVVEQDAAAMGPGKEKGDGDDGMSAAKEWAVGAHLVMLNGSAEEVAETLEKFRGLGHLVVEGVMRFALDNPSARVSESWIRWRRRRFSSCSDSTCISSSPMRLLLRLREIAADSRFLRMRCCLRVSLSSSTAPSVDKSVIPTPPLADRAACLEREAASFLRRSERAWVALGLMKATRTSAP